MPGGDRTGPVGMGPMTGRRAGFCAGFGVPGFINRPWGVGFFGRGRGGRGGGRGWRNMFYATGLTGWQRASMGWPAWGMGAPYGMPPVAGAPAPQEEAAMLRRQADYLATTLEEVRKRLDELEKAQTEKKD